MVTSVRVKQATDDRDSLADPSTRLLEEVAVRDDVDQNHVVNRTRFSGESVT